MQSMTGFGFVSAGAKGFHLEISLKSVNSRFLDIKFYTPPYYAPLEPELKRLISQKCRRGYFVVRIDRYPQRPFPFISLSLDKQQAKKWKQLYDSLAKEMKSNSSLTAGDLICREGVVKQAEKPQSLSLQERKKVKESFSRALRSCLQERKREGLALKKDILRHTGALKDLFKEIEALNEKQKKSYMKKKDRQARQNSKLAKDMAMDMEKFDIHEELIRGWEHLKHFQKMSASASAVGRKMDFYVQEILRELNTIGSKSQLSALTLKAVEGKFLLEKIKEQIQNIE